MSKRSVPASVADVHRTAQGMPHVTDVGGKRGRAVYQVGRKAFIYFRGPRPDAVDPVTGEKWDDVIVIWVESEREKQALVADRSTPYFTTRHFNGHLSVLVRASRLAEVNRDEIVELVQDAWLSRASPSRARAWLAERGLAE